MTSAHFSWLPQDPRWDLQGIVEYSVQMRPVWCCILCPILCNACSLLGDSQSQQQFPLISGQDYWPTSTRVLQRNTSCGVAEWPKYAQGEQAAAEPGQLAWPRVRWGWSRWRWCYRPWATTEVLKTSTLRSKKIIEDERWLVGLWFAKVMEQKNVSRFSFGHSGESALRNQARNWLARAWSRSPAQVWGLKHGAAWLHHSPAMKL